MKMFFVRLLCCFIPVKTWRHKVRTWVGKSTLKPCTVKSDVIDNIQAINNIQTELKHIKTIVESIKFQQTCFLNYYVDIKKVIPARGGMRQIQEKRLQVLNLIVDILEENNIDYWLDGGTLLGAVRHNCFIPWDDDIDIGIFIQDRDRMLKIINEKLKKHPVYKCIDASQLRNYPENCFYKIVGKKDNYEYIDIFCFDFSKKYKNAVYKLWWAISSANKEKYISKPSYSFSTEVLLPLSTIKFEGRTYKCPADAVKYVELQYGNYQNFPSKPYEQVVWDEMNAKLTENLEEF